MATQKADTVSVSTMGEASDSGRKSSGRRSRDLCDPAINNDLLPFIVITVIFFLLFPPPSFLFLSLPFGISHTLFDLDSDVKVEAPVPGRRGYTVVPAPEEARVLELLAVGVLVEELEHIFVRVGVVECLVGPVELALQSDDCGHEEEGEKGRGFKRRGIEGEGEGVKGTNKPVGW